MVSDTQSRQLALIQAIHLRHQANDLLGRLVISREQSEKRQAEAGKRDPLKFITGRTALDNAIAATRQMIVDMDELLGQAEVELNGAGHNGHTQATALPRHLLRNGRKNAQQPSRQSISVATSP